MTITGSSDTHQNNIMLALHELHKATADLTAARNNHAAAITAAHDVGISLRNIAAATNVSHQTVANIISKHRAGNS